MALGSRRPPRLLAASPRPFSASVSRSAGLAETKYTSAHPFSVYALPFPTPVHSFFTRSPRFPSSSPSFSARSLSFFRSSLSFPKTRKQRERAGNQREGLGNERAAPSPSFPQAKFQWEETQNRRGRGANRCALREIRSVEPRDRWAEPEIWRAMAEIQWAPLPRCPLRSVASAKCQALLETSTSFHYARDRGDPRRPHHAGLVPLLALYQGCHTASNPHLRQSRGTRPRSTWPRSDSGRVRPPFGPRSPRPRTPVQPKPPPIGWHLSGWAGGTGRRVPRDGSTKRLAPVSVDLLINLPHPPPSPGLTWRRAPVADDARPYPHAH